MVPTIYITRQRTGAKTILFLAQRMCRLIARWRPLILELTGNNPDLKAAFDAALLACAVLDERLRAHIPDE